MSQALDPVTQHHVHQAAERSPTSSRASSRARRSSGTSASRLDLLGGARINVFVPVLAHRFARERLRALAQAEGSDREGATRGAVRLRPQRGPQPDGGRPRQAPLRGPDPRPLGRQRARRRDQPGRRRGDGASSASTWARSSRSRSPTRSCAPPTCVITMGCGDACPIYPGKRYEDWVLDDPAGQGPRDRARGSATRSTRACRR